MNRRKIVAGNWKMNTTLTGGVELVNRVIALSHRSVSDGRSSGVELIVGVPFTHLAQVADVAHGSGVAVAAQNCSDHASGAYTGEVSAEMVRSTGAGYVILGHSERREYYGETSETLRSKLELVYQQGLKPIFCVGERLDQRESGQYFDVVRAQIEEVIFGLSDQHFADLIIAYEPVWAIGTGKTASADQAEEIHSFIRAVLNSKFGTAADKTAILYGGSCKPSNAMELFAKANVDGGLIGGASLVAEDFIAIAEAF